MMTTMTSRESFSKLPIASSNPVVRGGARDDGTRWCGTRRIECGVYGLWRQAQP